MPYQNARAYVPNMMNCVSPSDTFVVIAFFTPKFFALIRLVSYLKHKEKSELKMVVFQLLFDWLLNTGKYATSSYFCKAFCWPLNATTVLMATSISSATAPALA